MRGQEGGSRTRCASGGDVFDRPGVVPAATLALVRLEEIDEL